MKKIFLKNIMKIALVHDYLNQWGGGEVVLETLAKMFPDAPIYTLLYDKERTLHKFEGRVRGTSFLDFPFARHHHRLFIPLMPLAAWSIRIPKEYEVVISSSAGFAKGVRTPKHAKHIAYIHSPLRYAWEQDEYLLGVISKFQLSILKPILNYLKRWDYRAGQKPNVLIANSQFIAEKIKKYYGRNAEVIYPPVDNKIFYPDASPSTNYSLPTTNYFLAIGRFLHYKRFDLIIDAFNDLELPLVVMGTGPEEKSLQRLRRSNNITFLPFTKNITDLRKLYNGARALIFPQVEDFGLVAAEAQMCGTPVIAYHAGGAKEIVSETTGIFFREQKKVTLLEAIETFIKKESSFNRETIAHDAQKFSKEKFTEKIKNMVNKH